MLLLTNWPLGCYRFTYSVSIILQLTGNTSYHFILWRREREQALHIVNWITQSSQKIILNTPSSDIIFQNAVAPVKEGVKAGIIVVRKRNIMVAKIYSNRLQSASKEIFSLKVNHPPTILAFFSFFLTFFLSEPNEIEPVIFYGMSDGAPIWLFVEVIVYFKVYTYVPVDKMLKKEIEP